MHRKPTGPAPITTTGRPAEPVGLPDVSGACSGVTSPGVDVSSAGLLGWQPQPLDPAGPVPQHWAFAAASQQLTCSAGAQHPFDGPPIRTRRPGHPTGRAVRLVRGNLGTNTQVAIDGAGSHPGATDLRAS